VSDDVGSCRGVDDELKIVETERLRIWKEIKRRWNALGAPLGRHFYQPQPPSAAAKFATQHSRSYLSRLRSDKTSFQRPFNPFDTSSGAW
jgi:hypothetical protein